MANEILKIVLHVTAFGTLLCAGLLFLRRAYGDRSRLLLAWCFAFCGAVVVIRVLAGYVGCPLSNEVLLPSDLDSGLLTLMVFFLYPIEVIHPGWLNVRRIAVLLLPWIVFSVLWIFVPFRPLVSFHGMIAHAGEFNVWIRLLFLVMFVPMCFVLYSIPRNWAASSADNRWIRLYTVGTQGIAVLYLLSMLTGNSYINTLHIAYCMGFCLTVTYQELFLRLPVPVNEEHEAGVAVSISIPVAVPDASEPNPLWEKLNRLMDDEQPWRNPDLTLEMLAVRLNSNRTKLTKLIHRQGFEDYRHFINRRRIAEFLKIVEANPRVNIQETLFKVGFRSKMTALRYFRQYTGTTPTGYLRNGSEME